MLSTGWTPVFEQMDEHTIVSGEILATISKRSKEWKVKFEVKPTLPFSAKYIFKIGGHDPSFYIMSKEKVRFHFDQNGKNTHQDFTGSPPLEKWTKMEFKQEKEGSAYFITISMGEKILFKSENSTPEDKADIDVIGGTQTCKIKSLLVENKKK